jgi:hypothetical protein
MFAPTKGTFLHSYAYTDLLFVLIFNSKASVMRVTPQSMVVLAFFHVFSKILQISTKSTRKAHRVLTATDFAKNKKILKKKDFREKNQSTNPPFWLISDTSTWSTSCQEGRGNKQPVPGLCFLFYLFVYLFFLMLPLKIIKTHFQSFFCVSCGPLRASKHIWANVFPLAEK